MLFGELSQSSSTEPAQTSQKENAQIKAIQFKLGELINNISRFDNEKTGKLTKARYESFMSTNNELINTIDELMKSEMNCPDTQKSKTIMLRFQKVFAEQKRKLKLYAGRSWSFAEEKKKSYEDEENGETAQLLQNDIDVQKIERFEDFLHDRNTRVSSVLKNMHVANQIYKDKALMTQEQSEKVEIVHHNLDTTEVQIKDANKELQKTKYFSGPNYFKYIWVLLFLIFTLFAAFYMIQTRSIGILSLVTNH